MRLSLTNATPSAEGGVCFCQPGKFKGIWGFKTVEFSIKMFSPATTMSQPCLCELTRGCFFCVERWPRPLTLCFFLFTLLFDSLKVWKKRWLKVSLSVHKVRGSFLFKLFYLVLGYSQLTYMQSTSWKRWAGRSISWNQDCWEKYQ